MRGNPLRAPRRARDSLGRWVRSGICNGCRLAIASPRPVSLAEMSSLRSLATTSSSSPVVSPSSKVPSLLAIVEYRAGIGAREVDRTVDDGLQHDLEIERRAYRATDFAQGLELLHRASKFARSGLHLLKQPHILDGDHGLVGEGLDQLNLLLGKGLDFASLQAEDTEKHPSPKHRDAQERPEITDPLSFFRVLKIGVSHGVDDMDRLARDGGSPMLEPRPARTGLRCRNSLCDSRGPIVRHPSKDVSIKPEDDPGVGAA